MLFSFLRPSYLVGLFLIPAFIFLHFYALGHLRGKSIRFANFGAIARIKGVDVYSKNIVILILNLILIASLVFSLAGFTWHRDVDTSEFSFIIAIDSSESMGATDMSPNRLEVAKRTSMDFIDSLPFKSKAGVISFSGNTFIEHRLSDDKTSLKAALNDIELTRFGGTDVYEAVSISLGLLQGESQGAIIVLSDGQVNVGSVSDAIDYALENNVLIHTFGIGTLEGGETIFGLSRLDENSLKSLSYNTEGQYFSVYDEQEMAGAFESVVSLTRKTVAIDLSFYLILLAGVVLVVKELLAHYYRISI